MIVCLGWNIWRTYSITLICSWKVRGILVTFTDNLWIFFFDAISKLYKWSFIKTTTKQQLECGSWNHFKELFTLNYLLNMVFIHVWPCKWSCIWSFKKYWFTELCGSSRGWQILIIKWKKIAFVKYHTVLIRKVFKYGDAIWVADTFFPEFEFLLKSCQLFSLKWQIH